MSASPRGTRQRGRSLSFTRAAPLALALLCLGAPAYAQAQTEGKPSESEPALKPLPSVPSRRFEAPTDEARKLLDDLLSRVVNGANSERATDIIDLLDVDESLLPAIRERIDTEAKGADRAAMKELLLSTRRQFRKEAKEQDEEKAGASGEIPDYLTMLLSRPRSDSADWKRLVNVLTLSRMCVRLGTIEAARALIHVYVRFDFLRIDTQLQLKVLDNKALAALIEATRHPAPEVSSWARRRLDFLGKAIPSEAINVGSSEVLADVLRAYGYLKDPDAARLVVSFANSERLLVREAARQSVVSYGEVGNWQLRDAYEQVTGVRPAREWSWERTARELFRQFDRTRLADVYQLFESGSRALEAGDLPAMRQAFDQVVTRNPNFDQADKLAEGYWKYADAMAQKDPQASLVALERVARLTADPARKASAESLRLTIEAKSLAARQLADQSLLRSALELDPKNERAQTLLHGLEAEPLSETTRFVRYLWPAVLGVMSALFTAIVLLKRRRSVDQP
jgi:hypothetical protein